MPDGQVPASASIQCATIIAFDDLDENSVNLAAHVPDLGFSTWEESTAGQFAGEFNSMANLTVSDVIARSGEDVAIVGKDIRIQVNQFRGGVDSATQRGRLVILGRGADTIDQNGGFERIEVGWERVSSTLVSMQFRRFNAADAQQEGAQIGSNFTFAINTGLRMIVDYEHPNITVFTTPTNQNSPKTLIGSISITGDIRGTANQRIGISSGAASSNRTFFSNLTVFALSIGDGETQAVGSIEVAQNGETQADASIQVILPIGEVQVVGSVVVEQHGTVQVDASLAVTIQSEVQVAASIQVIQNSQVNVAASIQNTGRSQVQIPADVRVIQQNRIFITGSIQVGIITNGEVLIDSSINAAQQNEVQVAASINLFIISLGQVFVGCSIEVIQRGQVQIVSSLQPSFNGEESADGSIEVVQRIDGQVSAQSSIIVKFSGAIEDPIFEDNRVNVEEFIEPILWRS